MHAHLALGLLLVLACLGTAVVRPLGVSEAFVAVPCVAIALASGVTTSTAARHTTAELAPTVLFLAAILVFGHLCATEGVFDYLGSLVAHASNGEGGRLLVLVTSLAAVVTATLTLDATVVLVTPVVLATAHRLRISARPHSYACAHLSNSGSLLLPVSNLTNLLVFKASGLSFGRFALAMTLPWLVVCALNWLTLRLWFRRDLAEPGSSPPPLPHAPVRALVVLGATIAGFVLTTAFDIAPAWAALAGCVALGVPLLRRRALTVRQVVTESSPGFCLFVLGLGVLVDGVLRQGLDRTLRHVIPAGTGLLAVLGLTFTAAVLANVANNLPTTLALTPLVAHSPLAVLAVLVGVNIGPNAAYPGSLATLLWRRTLPDDDKPRAWEFHALGLLSVPVLLTAATTTLWLVAAPIGLR
jgi:arsenical pump membrane protein